MIVLDEKTVRYYLILFWIVVLGFIAVALALGRNQQIIREKVDLIDRIDVRIFGIINTLKEIQESRTNCDGVVPSIINHNPRSVYITTDRDAVDVIIDTIKEDRKPVKKKKKKKKKWQK